MSDRSFKYEKLKHKTKYYYLLVVEKREHWFSRATTILVSDTEATAPEEVLENKRLSICIL